MIETAATDIVVPFAMRDHVRQMIENPDSEPDFDGVYGIDVLMITEETARRLGFDIVEFGAIVRNDTPLTQDPTRRPQQDVPGHGAGRVVSRRRRHRGRSLRLVGVPRE